jgi:hypothetical protein
LWGAASLFLAAAAPFAYADSYNEILYGDLSSDPIAPTTVEMFHPDSTITGITGGGDFDFVDIEVAPYHTLDSIVVRDYTGLTQSFVGLQLGSVWTAGTGAAINPSLLLGWTHFGTTAPGAGVGSDILDDLATPTSGSAGFTRPLGPGHYAMLIQDTGSEVGYEIRFNLSFNYKPVGDFNGDTYINRFDVAKWRFEYLNNAGSDADGDGDSDGNDFLIWQRNVNRTVFDLSAVPEPSAGLLALSGGFAALRRFRWRPGRP